MAFDIECTRRQYRTADGIMGAVFDLHVDSTDDLPALGDLIDGMAVCKNSIAADKTGIWYKLAADGKWYIQDGSGDAAGDEPNAALNSSPRGNETLRKDAEPEQEEEPELKEEPVEEPEPEEKQEPEPEPEKEPEEEPEEEPKPDGGDMR